jgi:hypothetical protein
MTHLFQELHEAESKIAELQQQLRETQLLLCDTQGLQPSAKGSSATAVSPMAALNLLNVMFLRADPMLLKYSAAFRQFSAALASPPDERSPPLTQPSSSASAPSNPRQNSTLIRAMWRLAALAATKKPAAETPLKSPLQRRDSSASAIAAAAAIMYALLSPYASYV